MHQGGCFVLKYLFVLFLVFSQAFAVSIVISDVDDTIKDSRIRNYWEMVLRGPRTGPEMMIPGMRDALYHILEVTNSETVFYVSKMPSVFEAFHEEFLESNKFPAGILITRGLETDFKLNNITEIIEKTNASQVFLIGDNGEADSKIYHQIEKRFRKRGVHVLSFIRKAYADNYKIYEGQYLFNDGCDLVEMFQK